MEQSESHQLSSHMLPWGLSISSISWTVPNRSSRTKKPSKSSSQGGGQTAAKQDHEEQHCFEATRLLENCVYTSLKELGYCSEGRLLGKIQVQHNVRKGALQRKLYSAASMAKKNSSDGVHEDQVNVTASWPNSVMKNYYLLPSKTL